MNFILVILTVFWKFLPQLFFRFKVTNMFSCWFQHLIEHKFKIRWTHCTLIPWSRRHLSLFITVIFQCRPLKNILKDEKCLYLINHVYFLLIIFSVHFVNIRILTSLNRWLIMSFPQLIPPISQSRLDMNFSFLIHD